MPIPPQAAAAGYTTQTLATTFKATEVDIGYTQANGFNWYLWNFGVPPVNTAVLNPDGSVTLNGTTTNLNGELTSISYLGSPGRFAGTAYGGGGYLEATIKFNPNDAISSGFSPGWPSWWTMTEEHFTFLDAWPNITIYPPAGPVVTLPSSGTSVTANFGATAYANTVPLGFVNFPTASPPVVFDPAQTDPRLTISGGGLTVTRNADPDAYAESYANISQPLTGKYYCEFFINAGLAAAVGYFNQGFTFGLVWLASGDVFTPTTAPPVIGSFTAGNTIAIAIDVASRLFWGRVGAGNWNNDAGANPATGIGGREIPINPYVHFAELDIMEYNLPSVTNTYSRSYHDWHGVYTGSFQQWAFANFGQIVADFNMATDFTQFHKYGMLWVPATDSMLGYVRWFFDDVEVGQPVTWTKYNPSDGPINKTVFSETPDHSSFGWENANLRQVIQPSLLAASQAGADKIKVNFHTYICQNNSRLDSAWVGHGTVTAGGIGANLIDPVFTGTLGNGNTPTGWIQAGDQPACNTLEDPGTVNGIATFDVAIRYIVPSVGQAPTEGFQQTAPTWIAGRKYKFSAWLRLPTGVTASDARAYIADNRPLLADAATLTAQAPDTWVYHEVDYTATGLEYGVLGYVNNGDGANAVAGKGFDIALPSVQLYGQTLVTFDGNQVQLTFNRGATSRALINQEVFTSDPRPFAYDNTKPLIVSAHYSGDLPFSVFLQNQGIVGADAYVTFGPDTSGANVGIMNDVQANQAISLFSIEILKYAPISIIDAQHLTLILGTGPNAPMQVKSVNVWQLNGSGNLPPFVPPIVPPVEPTTITRGRYVPTDWPSAGKPFKYS